jgi:hypothetical protein
MAGKEAILVGTLGDVRIGLPLADLREVLRAPGDGPGGAAFPYRGGTLPVVDLAARMGIEAPGPFPRARVLVLRRPDPVGVRISAVEGIAEVSTDSIVPASRVRGPGPGGDALRGLVRIGGRMVTLLVADALAAMAGETEAPRGRGIPEKEA